jgi:hypothetical protein
LAETEYLLMVSRDLGYITPIMAEKSLVEISELSRKLHGLRKKVEAAGRTTRPDANQQGATPLMIFSFYFRHSTADCRPLSSRIEAKWNR